MSRETILRVDKQDRNSFGTIAEALGAAEGYWGLPVLIDIAPGTYPERITIAQPFITLSGHPEEETLVTWDHGALEILADGVKRGTFRTATVRITGNGFAARNISFENSAGPGDLAGQALACSVDTEAAFFEKCRFKGHQDTLFLAPLPPAVMEKNGFAGPGESTPRTMGYHYFLNCFIEGDVDFIFGGATAFFENCEIFSRNRNSEVNGYVAAPCTPEGEKSGFVFFRCRFTGDCPPGTVYLGRPWRNFGKTAVIQCRLGAHIHPEGFHDWSKKDAWNTLDFAEYGNTGEGSDPSGRAGFVRLISEEEKDGYSKEVCLAEFRRRYRPVQ